MSEEISIGVIGAGNIFRRRHFPALKRMDDVSITAIANRSVKSARDIASEFDLGAETMDDPYAVIERNDIDAVMVGTWPSKHHPYGMAALDAGKHTFLQARMAMNLREAKELYAKAQETEVTTQVCPSPLAMHGDSFVRGLLADSYVGDVYEVYGDIRSGRNADPDEPRHWRQVERYQGLNALALGILIEVVHRWVGFAATVSAHAETHIKERPLPDGDGTGPVERPTTVHINSRMENGATGNFVFSEVARHAPASRIGVYGSDGTLVYNLDTDTLLGAKAGDDELSEISIPEDEVNEWTVERDFVDAIRHGDCPQTAFYEGMKYMEFTEAAFRSAETGSEIALPLAEVPSVS